MTCTIPANPRNIALLREASAWVRSWAGADAVYAARLDLDEDGGAVVDVFAMPARVDRRSGKLKIATSKALTELRLKHNQRMSYVAMQTDWAEWCQLHLDSAICRGTSKTITKADHLGVDEYKAAHEWAQAQVEMTLDDANALSMEIISDANNSALSTYLTENHAIERDRHLLEQERARIYQQALQLEEIARQQAEEQQALILERQELQQERRAPGELRRYLEAAVAKIGRYLRQIMKIDLNAKERRVVAEIKGQVEQMVTPLKSDVDNLLELPGPAPADAPMEPPT